MSIFSESSGMTRRQFFKGSGTLIISMALTGLFAKIGFNSTVGSDEYINQRMAGMYAIDERMVLRKSHQNPEIIQVYQDFLSPGEVKPLTTKAEQLLHTRYGQDIPGFMEEMRKPAEAGAQQVA